MKLEVINLFNLYNLYCEENKDGIWIHGSIWSEERDSGERSLQAFSATVPKDSNLPLEVKKVLLAAYEHEIDECLFVDGKRLKDPHWCNIHQQEFGPVCRGCDP